ncbi:MAG: alpha/beta fold hydrolase [Rhodospirillaceae bacterium]|nr:alpha/beta fold hydrolase [Rhodospirillaceae bacterium]
MSRTPLILVPGLLCDAALWFYQIDDLADIADAWVPDTAKLDRMDDIADAILAEAPDRFALAGLSMGGYVALEIMRKAPERVLRLALLDTSARMDTAEVARRRRGLIQLSAMGKFKGVTPRLLPMLVHADKLEDQSVVQTIYDMAARLGRDGFVNQQQAILSRTDSLDILAGINCPTLVGCGRQDALTPLELSQEMAEAIPGAELKVFEDCGHLPALESPEETGTVLRDWLEM